MADDPRMALLNALGVTYRAALPVVFRDSPDHLAVLNAVTKEAARLEAAIETVRLQFFPQMADILLKVWEAQLGTTVAPGIPVTDRRNIVLTLLRRLSSTPSGLDWVANVTGLIGPGWTYKEHDPADGTSPPNNTIRITLPFPPSNTIYAQTETLIRAITPAHLDLQLFSASGMQWDRSQWDQEGWA